MRKIALFLSAASLLAATPLWSGEPAVDTEYPRAPLALIVATSGNHYPALTRALSTIGFEVREIADYHTAASAQPHLLIVPEAEGRQLDSGSVEAVLHDVESGTPLLLDGPTPLAEALGVKVVSPPTQITRYRWDHYAEDPIRLPGPLTCREVAANPALEVLALDPRHKAPLVVAGDRGRGRFVYSAIPLEPKEGMVFQYLPFLAQAVVDELHVGPSLAADNLCVYVDAGGEPKVDPAVVAARLKSWSVREVHFGAFYDSDLWREFTPRFIAALHQQGIAVYAWLEYPMVSTEFWQAHPQWREVTANGHDAIMDWRYHMALEDPACFQAVVAKTRQLMLDFDWDGVDFAELYFEAERDMFSSPGDFTPMHPTFRRMFKARYGADPIDMFDPDSSRYGFRDAKLRDELKDYRVDLITDLTSRFLDVLADCRTAKPYLQTTLTFIDTLRDPTVTERYGIDADRLLALQKRFGFAVEIEDPYTVWNSSPDRYRAIGQHYRARLLPGTPFTLDINVVDRTPPGRPLDRPRGLELYELVANVAENVDLITLYAYSTFSPDDMLLLPFVLGRQQISGAWPADGVVRAGRQTIWRTDTRGKVVFVDGREWPCWSDSAVLIPAGEHEVSLRPRNGGSAPDPIHVESINGEILAADGSGPHVAITYQSRGRCYLRLDRTPGKVLCDGATGVAQVIPDGDRVCLVLPAGKHQVEVDAAR